MKTRQVRQYIAIVVGISFGISILVHFNAILELFAGNANAHFRPLQVRITDTLTDLLITFLVAFLLFMINYYLINPFNNAKKIGLMQVARAILITLGVVYLLTDVLFELKHAILEVDDPNKFALFYFFKDLFIAAVVLICVFVIRVINDKQVILLENERLIRENLQSQYESLKNQVSPHFLFNSLTALKTLIRDDPENAGRYVNDLSQVLRYTLQSNENLTVSLSDEIEAAKSYIFLIRMRFNTNLNIAFHVDARYNQHRLPPLTLQTLLENAVKHNEISKRHPLDITISTTDKDSLVVTNTLQEKLSLEPGTGIGLVNLSKQYKLLRGLDIRISKSNNLFRVEVPLLKPTSDEGSNC
ncbi:MAG: histidine kinase [Bacteroidales bacterium]|nr:histidine kinase [Bacteroidales bacterium]